MRRTMSVAQLSMYVKGVFDDEELLHDITLVGEVAEVSYSDRHTFVVLSEGAYSVRCVHFSSRDQIEKGARVALSGGVSYYDKRNSLSFTYKEFFVRGQGDKDARLSALRSKLAGLGYFENRPQLPRYITSVVAVTSPDGAAIRDLIRVVHDKNPFVSVKVYPVKVQGEGAAVQMTKAVKELASCAADAIVLCRGGGSDEDLDSFNDEELATAVALSPIPVISAVGHEVDYTLCDFCAGTRAGTPSIAGEIVNSRASRIVSDIFEAMDALNAQVKKRYASECVRLVGLGGAVTKSVSVKVAAARASVGIAADKGLNALRNQHSLRVNGTALVSGTLSAAADRRLREKRAATDALSAMLAALDPHRIFKAGYAAVVKGGRRVSEAAALATGESVQMIFPDGVATATVTDIKRYK